MKLAQYFLSASMMIAISICIPVLSSQWGHYESHRPVQGNIPSTEWSGKSQWFTTVKTNSDVKGLKSWKDKKLVRRTEEAEVLALSNELLDDDLDSGPGIPTHNEAKEVLSTKEYKSLIKSWRGYKAYKRAHYAVRKAGRNGLELSPKVVEKMESYKPDVAAYEKLLRVVENRLLKSGKARPATVARIEGRRARKKEKAEAKKIKIEALRARIEAGKASAQDRRHWDELEAKRIQLNEYERKRKDRQAKKERKKEERKKGGQAEKEPRTDPLKRNESLRNQLVEKQPTKDPESPEAARARRRKQNRDSYAARRIKIEALRARIEDGQATGQDREEWEELKEKRREITVYERSRRVQKKAKKANGSSEDISNQSTGTASNELEPKSVNHFDGTSLFHGGRHLIEHLREKWQAIPWSLSWPNYRTDKPPNGWGATPWKTNGLRFSPPLIRRIP